MVDERAIRTFKNSLIVTWVILMFIGLLESVAFVSELVFDVGVGVSILSDFIVAVTSYGLIAFVLCVVLFLVYEVASEVFTS
jgi:hypothetical protein